LKFDLEHLFVIWILEFDIERREVVMMGNKITFRYFFVFVMLLTSMVLCNKVSFAQDPSPYRIGPGDVLNIYVWKERDLTRDVNVLPDGKITFPLIGELQAQGLTVAELKKVISEKLQSYVTAPEVTVVVVQPLSRRIYVIGQVANPGQLPLMPGMTVLQALSAAGGFTQWANEKKIRVIRREGDKEVQYRFNYKEYISGKNIEQNILLKRNDTIVVP
jgi:polysaccharide export outer membrane protein